MQTPSIGVPENENLRAYEPSGSQVNQHKSFLHKEYASREQANHESRGYGY